MPNGPWLTAESLPGNLCCIRRRSPLGSVICNDRRVRSPLPPVAAVIGFIDAINRGDVDRLVALMSPGHRLQVLREPPLAGRDANREAWHGYVTAFPDYVIYPDRFVHRGDEVLVLGSTTGSHLGLPDEEERELKVIWCATGCWSCGRSWRIRPDSERSSGWLTTRSTPAAVLAGGPGGLDRLGSSP